MTGAFLTMLGAGGGASAVTIQISPQTLFASRVGATPSAAYQLNANGNVEFSANGGAFSVLEAWCVPAAQAANYECYANLVSGTVTGGTLITWLALSSTQTWSVSRTNVGVESAILNIGIRRIGTSTVLAAADIELTAIFE